jgi:hypothetical protein
MDYQNPHNHFGSALDVLVEPIDVLPRFGWRTERADHHEPHRQLIECRRARLRMLMHIAHHRRETFVDLPTVNVFERALFAPRQVFLSRFHALSPPEVD